MISPFLASGSSLNSELSSGAKNTGSVGGVFSVTVLFCSSVSTWSPRSFSTSQTPRKHSTSITPLSESYSTLIQVPLGEAVPNGVTIFTGWTSLRKPSSTKKSFPSFSSIIAASSNANCPSRQVVLGVVLTMRKNS